MPSLRFAAPAVGAPQTVALERRDCKIKPTYILVDNTLGAADRMISLSDTFTPDVSAGVAIPVAITAAAGVKWTATWVITACEQVELEDIEILGNLVCFADAADAGCIITIGYSFIED